MYFPGPTLTLTSNVFPTDLLTLSASGQVFLAGGNTYGTNAAGVVTTAGTTGVGGTGLFGAYNFGSLLLGNSTVGFYQLFPANASQWTWERISAKFTVADERGAQQLGYPFVAQRYSPSIPGNGWEQCR